jgi:hypothetical protein
MASTEITTHSDHHLTDQERFQIGGRDTVLVVWSLVLGLALVFHLLTS